MFVGAIQLSSKQRHLLAKRIPTSSQLPVCLFIRVERTVRSSSLTFPPFHLTCWANYVFYQIRSSCYTYMFTSSCLASFVITFLSFNNEKSHFLPQNMYC